MIQTNYDPESDVLQIKFGPPGAVYHGSQEVAPGVYVEFDAAGNPIGIEITSAQRNSVQPATRPVAAE